MNNYAASPSDAYDDHFVFKVCGFDWVPDWIDRSRLFNVSYDFQSQEVKLYFLDSAGDTLFKISDRQIQTQQLANTSNFDAEMLFSKLGVRFDLRQIVPDTIEGDSYYMYLEPAGALAYSQFLAAVARWTKHSDGQFLDAINHINQRRITGFTDAHKKSAVSLVRLSLHKPAATKLYSRPFLHANGFVLPQHVMDFLCRLYNCAASVLPNFLQHAWISIELGSQRMVIATQRHALLHADAIGEF